MLILNYEIKKNTLRFIYLFLWSEAIDNIFEFLESWFFCRIFGFNRLVYFTYISCIFYQRFYLRLTIFHILISISIKWFILVRYHFPHIPFSSNRSTFLKFKYSLSMHIIIKKVSFVHTSIRPFIYSETTFFIIYIFSRIDTLLSIIILNANSFTIP